MYLNDKILRGAEITSQGVFDNNGQPFYLFMIPKVETAGSSAVISAQPLMEKVSKDFPFSAGIWNPVVLNSVNLTAENLQNYRIFYGMES